MWPFTESYPSQRPEDIHNKTFDYVIIGGGTAGTVLASKLSEDPSLSILLIERGPVANTWTSRVPLLSMNYTAQSSPVVATHQTTPIANRGGYKFPLMAARVLGGGSRINATIATRGVPGGYNDWAENLGLDHWSWEKVEPYFKGLENAGSAKGDASREKGGPVTMRTIPVQHKFLEHLEKPCQTLGLPITSSPNSASTPAACYSELELLINESGQRLSSFTCFLNSRVANERKSHLTVCTNTIATRLEINEAGDSVVGVHIRQARAKGEDSTVQNKECFVKVRREAILCGGTYVSPQLLLLSGIGPRDSLSSHGIRCVQDLPVGQTFKDHVIIPLQVQVEEPSESLLCMQQSILTALWQFLLYIIWGIGLLGTGTTPRAIWFKTSHLDDRTMTIKQTDDKGRDTFDAHSIHNIPDTEIMTSNCSVMDRFLPVPNVFSILACLTQPESTGSLELTSLDPEAHTKVVYPYFTDSKDLITARKSMRFSMRLLDELLHNSGYPYEASILTAPSINRIPRDFDTSEKGFVEKLVPIHDAAPGVTEPLGPAATRTMVPRSEVEKTWDTVTDAEIDEYVLATGSIGYHGSCTNRMATSRENGVVDQRLKVFGMKNLRVADASVFPKLPSGHTQLPVMMVAMRCADFVREELKGCE